MNETLLILLVEDDKMDAELVEQTLRDSKIPFQLVVADNEEDYLANLSRRPDVVISDYMLPQFDGLRALALLKQSWMDIPFILISGKIGEETAVAIIKAGANNFIQKDNLSRLPTIILHEIEENKIRKQLSDLQDQYEKLVTLSPDAIFIQCDKKFVYVNRAGCDLLGANDPKQIIGRRIYEFFHPDYHDFINDRIKKIEAKSDTVDLAEEKMIDLNGNTVYVEVTAAPFQYEGRLAAQVFMRNITSRKEAEEKIKQQNIKIKKQIKKNKKLKSADVLKSEFMATVSHELRSPLNAIIGFSELLKEGLIGGLNDKQKQYSNDIFNAGQHLLALINDILDLSKIEAGKLYCDLEVIEMDDFIQECLLIVKDKASAHHIQIQLNIKDKLGKWRFDRRRFKQIIYNLISNAVKFTPDGGEVRVDAKVTPEAHLQISISDTGQGILEGDLQRLFHPFIQTEAASKSREPGTGLGLAIAKQLVELHHGTIDVRSDVGKGTIFTLNFPKEEAAFEEKYEKYIEESASQHHDEWNPIALVVEDDPQAVELISMYLKELRIEMLWKTSAEEALSSQYPTIPDFILLDIFLPGMSGIDMMHLLKKHPTLSNVPVIITSIAATENKSAIIHAADVLQKPIDRRQLIACITKIANAEVLKHKFRILLADDDRAALELVQGSLEGMDYELDYCANGEEAIQHIKKELPDVLILDLMMPKVNGFKVLEFLNSEERTKSIPVIVMTGKSLTDAEKKLLKSNAIQVMQKVDFLKDQLMQEIKRWI